MAGLKSRAFVVVLVVTAWRIVGAQVGVSVNNVITNVTVIVCKYGCGKLYKDWYGELVCPICGYHKYEKEMKIKYGDRNSKI